MSGVKSAVAIVPAYNEERLIAHTLEGLCGAKRAGTLDEVIVVDDGSTDATAEIAREHGAYVVGVVDDLGHPANSGKMCAFTEGLRAAYRFSPSIVLASDADYLSGLSPELVGKFLQRIRGDEDVAMLIGTCNQEGAFRSCSPSHSGFRAVRMRFLDSLVSDAGAPSWMDFARKELRGRLGYALEAVINALVPPGAVRYADLRLTSRRPGGGSCIIDDISVGIYAGRQVTGKAVTYSGPNYIGVIE